MEVKLLELVGEWKQVADMMNDPAVDQQAIIDTLEGITGEIEIKADGYGTVIRSLEYEVSALKGKKEYVKGILDDITAEEKRLQNHISSFLLRRQEALQSLRQRRTYPTTSRRSYTRTTTRRYGSISKTMK